MDLVWVTILCVSMFLLGWQSAILQEEWYIELKSRKQYRTPMYVKRKFLYVVPEGEYCEMIAHAHPPTSPVSQTP